MDVLTLTGDLVTQSKVAAAVSALGLQAGVALGLEKLAEIVRENPPRVVVIDLASRGVDVAKTTARLREVSPTHPPVIAFGPHVATAQLQAAVDAGCTEVLSRGEFFMQTEAVLRRYMK